tara:strand:- start:746 stop:1471 length:726 start_codon:yes stop_codon:yes gene_type:complete
MSKVFQQLPFGASFAVKPDTFNVDGPTLINELNGGLDGNNLPVLSVETTNIAPSQPVTSIAGAVSGRLAPLQTQGYFWKRRSSSFEGGTDVWTPIVTIDLKTDDWSRGWNKLSNLTNWTSFDLVFDALDGTLVGCANIDWQHGTDTLLCSSGGLSFSQPRGNDWWCEWGVFVNDTLVARSGKMPPKRHTTSLPFTVPVGSNNINIDVRWQANISDYATIGLPHGSELLVFSAEVWTRNVYR